MVVVVVVVVSIGMTVAQRKDVGTVEVVVSIGMMTSCTGDEQWSRL
jgi:hypothetical protein